MSNKLYSLIVIAAVFVLTGCNKTLSKDETNVLVKLLDLELKITRNDCAIKHLESEVSNGYDYLRYIEEKCTPSDDKGELRTYMSLNVGMIGTILEDEYHLKEVLRNKKEVLCDSFLLYYDSSSVEYTVVYLRVCSSSTSPNEE